VSDDLEPFHSYELEPGALGRVGADAGGRLLTGAHRLLDSQKTMPQEIALSGSPTKKPATNPGT
jgi:hypothetical protein